MSRVSPPDVARTSPGSNWSTSTTSSPRPARCHASDAPNVPAPTITTRSTPETVQRTAMLVAALASTLVIGHSSEGREIRATRVGAVQAPVKVLVVGDVHGNEPAGEAIVQALRRESVDGVQFWLIRTANPDGRKARSRHNARGVDLNRNFPYRWAKGAKGTYYPGPSAGSEPETKALMRFVRRIRPQLGIYYHQHMGITVRARERRHRSPTRLRPPHRAATPVAAELPRHGHRVAEQPDQGRNRVRG